MTKRLPPPPDDDVPQDELDAAIDLDCPVELRETDRAVIRSPHGLAFAISVDVSPLAAAFEKIADDIEARALAEAEAQKAERKARKLKPRKPRKLKP